MQAAFGTVVLIVCAVGIVGALVAMLVNGRTWEHYGKNRLTMDGERSGDSGSGPAAATAERDTEIRQLLEARNHHRRRRGAAPIEIEQELARLTGQLDAELLAEIRELVIARNYRRTRSGRRPLDVEAEIEREIAALR